MVISPRLWRFALALLLATATWACQEDLGLDDLTFQCAGDGDCSDEHECLSGPEDDVFALGYCGKEGCSGNDCGEGACAALFGKRYCLKKCGSQADCREGYLCAQIGVSLVCAPRCRTDDDCGDPALSSCGAGGRCEVPGAENGGGGDGGGGDVGVEPGGGQAAPLDTGCECTTLGLGPPASRFLPSAWLRRR